MEQYNLYKVVPLLVDYIDNLTNWYIRRSEDGSGKGKHQDKTSLTRHSIMCWLSFQSDNSFLPFLTETIATCLQEDSGAPESVHMSKFLRHSGATDEELDLKMSLVRRQYRWEGR